VLKNGMDPLAFLRYLLNLGEVAHMTTLTDALPDADEMDPECCYLGFEISFRSHASKDAIEKVFDFCRDDCDLHILPPNSKVADFLQLIEALPEETMRLGEILVKSGALTQEELDAGLRRQSGEKVGSGETAVAPPLGEILVQQSNVQPELVAAAAAKQKTVSEKKAAESSPDPGACRQAGPAHRPRRRTGDRRGIGQPAGKEERRGHAGRGHLGTQPAGRKHP
jgi:two-component system chemotaxis sensor kinase CheA